MNKFFNTCRRCLNPWVIGIGSIVLVGLIIFIPIVGIPALIVALPFIGCTVMCGVMVFMMKDKKG